MEKDPDPNTNDHPLKSKIYFIVGYAFLMAMALAWSVDNSIVRIFFAIGVFFVFLGFYSRPRGKDSQRPFNTGNANAGRPSTPFSGSFAKIFQASRQGSNPGAKAFARPSTPEDNRRLAGVVIAGIFIVFFIFFVGSIFLSTSEGLDESVVSYQAGEQYYLNGNYDSAYLKYREAWKANDQYSGAMVGYGKVLAIRNQPDSAIIMFDKALAITPDYIDASYNKALVYYNRDNFNECISILKPVLEANPEYYDAMLLLGDSYYEQKQFEDAMIWYTDAYQNGGMRSRALCHIMAYIFDTRGDYSRAIDLYKEALTYDSTVVDIYTRLGELLPNEDGNYYRTQAVKLKQR